MYDVWSIDFEGKFLNLLEKYAEKIVEKWVNSFVYHKDVEFERINEKIK